MKINIYAQKWINEDYAPEHEDWYTKNTEYIYSRCWASGGIIYGIVCLVLSTIIGLFTGFNLISMGAFLGALMFSYVIYAVDAYLLSKPKDADTSFALVLIFAIWTILRAGSTLKFFCALFGFFAFVFFCIYVPIKHMKSFKKFKDSFENMEDYFNEEDAKKFEEWKQTYYKSFGYGEDNTFSEEEFINNDDLADEARKLFEGFTSDSATLKKRYRELARQYHPDAGGDEEMFKRLVTVYEELNKAFV